MSKFEEYLEAVKKSAGGSKFTDADKTLYFSRDMEAETKLADAVADLEDASDEEKRAAGLKMAQKLFKPVGPNMKKILSDLGMENERQLNQEIKDLISIGEIPAIDDYLFLNGFDIYRFIDQEI